MDFIFQGFQSSFPAWIYLLIFLGTSVLAWWSYKDYQSIAAGKLYLLIGLRTTVFFVLVALLLNPYIKTERHYTEPPGLLVMLDNSASTGIEKTGYKGVQSYEEVIDALGFRDSSSIRFNFFTIGSETKPAKLSALTFDARQTNLAQAMHMAKANESDASAAIVISDGIFTKGQNPVFETTDINIPVFTVGLGDTTTKKDILVQSVSSNSTGYLNTRLPVSVNVSSQGFSGIPFQVQLRDGNEIISSKSIRPDLSSQVHELSFMLPLDNEGLQQYEIFIPKLAAEWTSDNNSQRFSVHVKDAKQHILSLAFEVHPDVKYIRSLLATDENTKLTKRTWLKNNRFIEGKLHADPDSTDLIVIHGYPSTGLSSEVENQLAKLVSEKPFIVTATPLFNARRFEQEITSLPVSVSGRLRYSPVTITPARNASSHPIMELPNLSYSELPTLSSPIESISSTPVATTLFNSVYQGKNIQQPVLVVQEIGNRRMAFITSYGWFRFNQNINSQIRDFGRQLILNTISWTATEPDNELLEVEPVQTTFNGTQNVIINAYLSNERDQVENDATIGLTISSGETESRHYSMENIGSGRYRLDLGILPEGVYSFEATARKGDRTIDMQKGEFAVSQSNAEFVNIRRNDTVLRQIAERTGGTYLPYDSLSGFWKNLQNQGLLKQKRSVETNFFYPYQHIGWFVVVILLLTIEWIIRKYFSLP